MIKIKLKEIVTSNGRNKNLDKIKTQNEKYWNNKNFFNNQKINPRMDYRIGKTIKKKNSLKSEKY